MKAGDIVIIPVPQSNGGVKKRPALLLKKMPKYGDWLVCGISTQLHQFINGFDEKLDVNHPDFKKSRLKKSSIVRLAFLATIESNQIPGTIGKVSANTLKKLKSNLSNYIAK
ncbi:MAG: type II toxin-antitoxin system PemK/MazF family toxin [Crocinitomicaceae bacterium]|nr:type II toxin-antitoxin system PemK/MazF family toxin [Crocinitomicaceae bacterium]